MIKIGVSGCTDLIVLAIVIQSTQGSIKSKRTISKS
jgi:hypothetical protein